MIDTEKFILAGKAIFTVTSKKSGVRFTFKVRQVNENQPHFVSLLSGPDNTSSYTFLGTIFNKQNYFHGRKSRIGSDAPSALAFNWVWNHRNDKDFADKVEVHHEGKCCRCGRALTVPRSIELGIGPECEQIVGW